MDEYQIGNFNTDSFDQMDQNYAEVDAGETGEMGYRQNQQGTIFVRDTKFSLEGGMTR